MTTIDEYGLRSTSYRDALGHFIQGGHKRFRKNQKLKSIISKYKQSKSYPMHVTFRIFHAYLFKDKKIEYRIASKPKWISFYNKYKNKIKKKPGSISIKIIPGYPKKEKTSYIQFKVVSIDKIDGIDKIENGISLKTDKKLLRIKLGKCEGISLFKDNLTKIKAKAKEQQNDPFIFK